MKNLPPAPTGFEHYFLEYFKKNRHFKNIVAIIFLLSPLLTIANGPTFFPGFSPLATGNSPLSVTESLRTNLYLLQPDNSTILADGDYAEYNNLYHDSVTLEDAGKMTNFLENIALVRYSKLLSVERRPIIKSDDTLFYKLWKTTQRKYQIELITSLTTNTGLQAFFEDNYLNTKMLLPLGGTAKINFTVNADAASAATDRFKIVFKPMSVGYSPLPVTFTSAKAYRQGNKVIVDWKVENEINIAKYNVEKSINGKDFTVINTIAVNGLNIVSGNYLWIDNSQAAGNVFYRIKSIDINGSIKYTSILSVKGISSAASITIYPNPVKGNTINLQIANQSAGIYKVKLINNAGQMVYSNKIVTNSNNMSQSIYVGNNVSKGIYQLEVKSADNSTMVKTVMLQ